ncbi:MAG: hypothetical protein U1F68_07475 [Gammaproteobacteria bacterium]
MEKDFLLALLGPAVTTLIGAFGIWFQEWRQAHSAAHQRRQSRQEALDTVDFLERWLRTQRRVCAPGEFEQIKQKVQPQLESLYQNLVGIDASVVVRPPGERGGWLTRALLLYRPRGFGAWLLHLWFYSILCTMLMFSIGIFLPPKPGSASSEFTWPAAIGGYLLFFIPLLAVRSWAISSADKRSRIDSAAGAAVGQKRD